MGTGNLPGPGEMFLDHTGHFIPDPEAARAALEALGFTVTPYSAQVQPDPATGQLQLTGTGNICVMLAEGYLEFLVHTADTPIGREFLAALERRAGLHLSAYGVADAAARHAALEAAGHPMRPLVHFSKDVQTETGVEAAHFTVARLAEGAMPEGRVQVLTHANEDAMWQPRWTRHRNGAQSLLAIVISAPSPSETAGRFARFLGLEPAPYGASFRLEMTRGAVEVLPEAEAAVLTGIEVEPGRSSYVAVRVGVADLARMRALAKAAGPVAVADDGSLVVPLDPALGRGAWIFEQV